MSVLRGLTVLPIHGQKNLINFRVTYLCITMLTFMALERSFFIC